MWKGVLSQLPSRRGHVRQGGGHRVVVSAAAQSGAPRGRPFGSPGDTVPSPFLRKGQCALHAFPLRCLTGESPWPSVSHPHLAFPNQLSDSSVLVPDESLTFNFLVGNSLAVEPAGALPVLAAMILSLFVISCGEGGLFPFPPRLWVGAEG